MRKPPYPGQEALTGFPLLDAIGQLYIAYVEACEDFDLYDNEAVDLSWWWYYMYGRILEGDDNGFSDL